jgi:hypothetical protein
MIDALRLMISIRPAPEAPQFFQISSRAERDDSRQRARRGNAAAFINQRSSISSVLSAIYEIGPSHAGTGAAQHFLVALPAATS